MAETLSKRLSAKEAADYAGCGTTTLYRAYNKGYLKGYTPYGSKKNTTFKPEDIERWLDGLPPKEDDQ